MKNDYISRRALVAGLRDYQKQCREHWMGPRMDDIIALVKSMPPKSERSEKS